METERKEIDSDPFVLVNSNEVDRDIAQAVGSRLGQQGIGYDIVERPEVFASYLATDEEHHGLMVIDGVCPPEWVQDQLRACRQQMLHLKTKAPVCALYRLDPAKTLRCKPPKFKFLEDGNDSQFQNFMANILARNQGNV